MSLYHGSMNLLQVNTILKKQLDGYVQTSENQDLESLMENNKPSGFISRKDAIFMVEDPELIDSAGGFTDYIYIVKSENVIKCDLAWFSEANLHLLNDDYVNAKICAQNYWSGIKYNKKEESCFELLANNAIITQLFENNFY